MSSAKRVITGFIFVFKNATKKVPKIAWVGIGVFVIAATIGVYATVNKFEHLHGVNPKTSNGPGIANDAGSNTDTNVSKDSTKPGSDKKNTTSSSSTKVTGTTASGTSATASTGSSSAISSIISRYPIAAGDSSGNQKLNAVGKITAMRLVARHTGILTRLHFKTRTTGGASYESGNLGNFAMEVRKVLANGLPDMSPGGVLASEIISASDPNRSYSAGAGDQAWINTNFSVTKGDEFVLLVKNTAPSPDLNYASINYLYFIAHNPPGAQSRNERNPNANDAYLGLDPREVVGASRDGGSSWSFPGTTDAGYNIATNIPVYIQEYSDGFKDGQPYYSASSSSNGWYSNTFSHITTNWHITEIAGYVSSNGGASPVSLSVNGSVKATVNLTGSPNSIARVSLPEAVDVQPGSTVSLTFTINNSGSGGIDIRPLYTDSYHWTGYLGLGSNYLWYTSGSAANVPSHYIAPVYPLPFWKTVGS